MSHCHDGHYSIKTNNGKMFEGFINPIRAREGGGHNGHKLMARKSHLFLGHHLKITRLRCSCDIYLEYIAVYPIHCIKFNQLYSKHCILFYGLYSLDLVLLLTFFALNLMHVILCIVFTHCILCIVL